MFKTSVLILTLAFTWSAAAVGDHWRITFYDNLDEHTKERIARSIMAVAIKTEDLSQIWHANDCFIMATDDAVFSLVNLPYIRAIEKLPLGSLEGSPSYQAEITQNHGTKIFDLSLGKCEHALRTEASDVNELEEEWAKIYQILPKHLKERILLVTEQRGFRDTLEFTIYVDAEASDHAVSTSGTFAKYILLNNRLIMPPRFHNHEVFIKRCRWRKA